MKKVKHNNNNLEESIVYSTGKKEIDFNTEKNITTLPPEKQDLRITLDKKLKGGKKATIIYNFVGSNDDLELLGKHLKLKCGVGGTVKDMEIILQGDCLEKVKSELTKLGYKYKLAGV